MKSKMSGTHKSMGKTKGSKAGVESGLAEVHPHTAGVGVETSAKSGRPKPAAGGSVAVK